MTGTLYLVTTPIGNLSDFSPRGIETLRAADLIAAEDTRNTLRLLNKFDIHTEMTSYHEFNRFEKAEELCAILSGGKNIALVTDAGTPGISDPGEVLVRRCREEGIPVVGIPGPAAFVDALVISGLPARTFSFGGFLPPKKKERTAYLEKKKNETETLILYEAPHHLLKTLQDIFFVFGDREIALCRELTKVHEEVIRGMLSEIILKYQTEEPRGEYVLVIGGRDEREVSEEKKNEFREIPPDELVKKYEEEGFSRNEAMKKTAENLGISKREVYRKLLEIKENR